MPCATRGQVRIALVHYTYLPVVAGVEIVMADHAEIFAQNGHAVTVVADHGAETANSAQRPGISLRSVAPLGIRSPLARRGRDGSADDFEAAVGELVAALRPIFAAQEVVMLHNVATMHFHLALTVAVWRLAEELTRVRFICWVHDLAACNPDYAPLPLDREPWSLLRRAHPRFTYVAVSALRQRQFAEITGQPPERCRTIPNGVHPTRLLDLTSALAALAPSHRLFQREVVLLHPARLLRRKNVELTLRVIAALKEQGHSCAALVTAPRELHSGDADAYERELRELHRELGLADDVFLLADFQPLNSRDLHSLFQLADALFFPSRQEGFGLPLIEAAVHRLPIFCSDIEPFRGLLSRGIVAFSAGAAPETIATLIAESLSRDEAHATRKQAIRDFSWETIDANFLSPLLAETDTH